jgi:hypothetical protein
MDTSDFLFSYFNVLMFSCLELFYCIKVMYHYHDSKI